MNGAKEFIDILDGRVPIYAHEEGQRLSVARNEINSLIRPSFVPISDERLNSMEQTIDKTNGIEVEDIS